MHFGVGRSLVYVHERTEAALFLKVIIVLLLLLPQSCRGSFHQRQAQRCSAAAAKRIKMPTARLDTSLEKPQVDLLVDLGHPLLNRVFDGFVKVGGVGAVHAASQDSVKLLLQDETNKKSLENLANRVGKEAVQWGLVAGLYSGVTYSLEEARGVHDWKNALFGGALTGVALSLTEPNPSGDRALKGALTGGAIATAAEILKNIT